MIWQAWWLWIALGIVLAIVETLAPAYFFLGFAIGAIAVGLTMLAGWVPSSLALLLVIFAAISLVAWLIVRRVFPNSAGSVKVWDKDINDLDP